jgi:hypothetical protein
MAFQGPITVVRGQTTTRVCHAPIVALPGDWVVARIEQLQHPG